MNLILTLIALTLTPVALWGAEITLSDIKSLPKVDVIVLGEVHDNPSHHQNQAMAVAILAPPALVFEMLTPDQAARVTPQNRQNAAMLAQVLGWEGTGWPDFALYYPIFAAAPQARIYGGNLPRGQVRRAITEGAAAVFGQKGQRFGLDLPLDATEQSTREADQMSAHCDALPSSMLGGMVQAQRLRDAALADAVLTAFAQTGGPVVLITGNGHARTDWGVPALIVRADPTLNIRSIGQFEETAPPNPPYEDFIITPSQPRPDPCLAFRKG